MKSFVEKIIWYLPIGGKLSQSFEGEDILLWRLFTDLGIKDGFFIDVGAFHPVQYNNTWVLRKRLGFRGINIEPSEKGFKQFKWRKGDITLRCLCGDTNGEEWYLYNREEPTLSKTGMKGVKMPMRTLETICVAYGVKKIDLLSIDVEGNELSVLEGHNWEIRPKVIICEINDRTTDLLIRQKGYEIYGKTKRNGIYIDA